MSDKQTQLFPCSSKFLHRVLFFQIAYVLLTVYSQLHYCFTRAITVGYSKTQANTTQRDTRVCTFCTSFLSVNLPCSSPVLTCPKWGCDNNLNIKINQGISNHRKYEVPISIEMYCHFCDVISLKKKNEFLVSLLPLWSSFAWKAQR